MAQPEARETEGRTSLIEDSVPGGGAFLAGLVLVIIGLFVQLVGLIGWVLIFMGAIRFASEVWANQRRIVARLDAQEE